MKALIRLLRLSPRQQTKLKPHLVVWVWNRRDLQRAAHERGVALSTQELNELLALLQQQSPMRWSDLLLLIEEQGVGRRLTKPELHRFVNHNQLCKR